MQNEMPFYEREEDALTACVQALGGAKRVGAMLWPTDKTIDDAHRLLLDCLNPNRPEKLSYRQITHLFRMAKQIGFHAGFNWFANECEYEANPINKTQQVDRLMELVQITSATLNHALEQLKTMQNKT